MSWFPKTLPRQHCTVKFIYFEKPTKFLWNLHRWFGMCSNGQLYDGNLQNLWHSQNIWTLLQTVLPGRAVPEKLLEQSDVEDIKSLSQKQSVKSRLFTSAEIKYQRFLKLWMIIDSLGNLNDFINYFYFSHESFLIFQDILNFFNFNSTLSLSNVLHPLQEFYLIDVLCVCKLISLEK